MKVIFKKAFRTKSGDIPASKEVEISDALAKGYIKNGYAVEVKQPPKPAKRTAVKRK